MSCVNPQNCLTASVKLDVFRLLLASTLVSLSFLVLLSGPLFFQLSFQAIDCRDAGMLKKRPDGLFVVEHTKLHLPLNSAGKVASPGEEGPGHWEPSDRVIGPTVLGRAGLKIGSIGFVISPNSGPEWKAVGRRGNPTTQSNFCNPKWFQPKKILDHASKR